MIEKVLFGVDFKKIHSNSMLGTNCKQKQMIARYFNRSIYFEEGHSDMKIENELLL